MKTTYGYDLGGRLKEVLVNGKIKSQFTYQANGQRTDVRPTIYDAQDRLKQWGNITFEYRNSGELLSRTQGPLVTTYAYDTFGNLKTVQSSKLRIDYLIDGLNRRIGKAINGKLVQGYVYQSPLQIAGEIDSSGQLVKQFVYGTKSNVPDYMLTRAGVFRIVSDQLGSPRFVVNVETGQVIQEVEYDAFGKVVRDTSPGTTPFGFAGGLYDRDTGLVRFGARDYDPDTGRWTNKDPILFNGGDTNLYGYVLNDPVNLVDPTGQNPALLPLTILGAAVGGYSNYMDSSRMADISATQVAVSTLVGAVTGAAAAAAASFGIMPGVLGAVGAGFGNNGINQIVLNPGVSNSNFMPSVDLERAGWSGALSGGSALISGATTNVLNRKFYPVVSESVGAAVGGLLGIQIDSGSQKQCR